MRPQASLAHVLGDFKMCASRTGQLASFSRFQNWAAFERDRAFVPSDSWPGKGSFRDAAAWVPSLLFVHSSPYFLTFLKDSPGRQLRRMSQWMVIMKKTMRPGIKLFDLGTAAWSLQSRTFETWYFPGCWELLECLWVLCPPQFQRGVGLGWGAVHEGFPTI